MKIAIVGRGRLGLALGLAAERADHAVTLLRRPSAPANDKSPIREDTLDRLLDWTRFDLVLFAFETNASSPAELNQDEALAQLKRIPSALPIGSAVMRPSPELLEIYLGEHPIAQFLTTPAAGLPGAIALLPRTCVDTAPLRMALPDLNWIETEPQDYLRLATLMVGSAIVAAALAHLVRARGGDPTDSEAEFLQDVLDDAKRLMGLSNGDGFRAFSSVATPGGYTERLHNSIFATKWPLEP